MLPKVPGVSHSPMLSLRNGAVWLRLASPLSSAFDPPVILSYHSRSTVKCAEILSAQCQ
jgi:hypothetical protein